MRRFAVASLLACLLAGAAGGVRAEPTDRIVSVGGAITEILYELGLGDRIVAVDTTSYFPAPVLDKPKLGYMRALAAEPIIALNPTMVIADGDAGPPAVLQQLREAGVNLVIAPDEPTVANVYEKISVVAHAVSRDARGEALSEAIRKRLRAVSKALATVTDKPRVLFLLSVGRGSPLAGGNETSADVIIELAGGINAAAGFTRYKAMPPEAVAAVAPEVVLVTERSLGMLGGKAGLLKRPEIAATPAGRAERIVAIDGLLLLGFGPRTGEAAAVLAQRLHRGLSLEPASD